MYHVWIYLKRYLYGKGKQFHKTITVFTSCKPVIIDVRYPAEFKKGHLKGAVNISIDRISTIIPDLIRKQKPVIVTSRKGERSEMATGFLKEAGVEAYDGGPWVNLEKW
jgi:rhodanese-related sulfurtransferase